MHSSIKLGSHKKKPRKKPIWHGPTPGLCRICCPNHEINHQLCSRATNCNFTDDLCTWCPVITNKIMQAYKEIIKSTGIDFGYLFLHFLKFYSCPEFSLNQVVVITSCTFTFTSVITGAQCIMPYWHFMKRVTPMRSYYKFCV